MALEGVNLILEKIAYDEYHFPQQQRKYHDLSKAEACIIFPTDDKIWEKDGFVAYLAVLEPCHHLHIIRSRDGASIDWKGNQVVLHNWSCKDLEGEVFLSGKYDENISHDLAVTSQIIKTFPSVTKDDFKIMQGWLMESTQSPRLNAARQPQDTKN